MAQIEYKGLEDYAKALAKYGDGYDNAVQKMVQKGIELLGRAVRAANPFFSKYVKVRKASRNEYGWWSRVDFLGTTSSGARAGTAVGVYEFGVEEGYDKTGKISQSTNQHRKHGKQEARPFIQRTVAEAENGVQRVMQEQQDEYDRKMMGGV